MANKLEDWRLRTAIVPQLDVVVVRARNEQILVGGAPADRLDPLRVTEVGVLDEGALWGKMNRVRIEIKDASKGQTYGSTWDRTAAGSCPVTP